MKYTIESIDMLKVNTNLTNLLDVLFIAQGIMETHAKFEKELWIVGSFGDTYREIYNVARIIKSCLNDKIVLRHNSAFDLAPSIWPKRMFGSTRMLLKLKETKLEKMRKADGKQTLDMNEKKTVKETLRKT